MDNGYVRYIVHRYLKNRPALEVYRDDLIQEGMIAQVEAEETFDPKYNKDKDLYVHYAIKYAVVNYVRSESKHFRKKTEDQGSPRWDLPDYVDVEQIEDTSVLPPDAMRLSDITDRLDLTERQREVLEVYLRLGDHTKCAESLGMSRQAVHQSLNRIIAKAKKHVDIKGS